MDPNTFAINLRINQEVLRQARDIFVDQFEPNPLFLAFLESRNPQILTAIQRQELGSIALPQERVQRLFDLLSHVESSVDALIQYFTDRHRTQPHLRQILITLRHQERVNNGLEGQGATLNQQNVNSEPPLVERQAFDENQLEGADTRNLNQNDVEPLIEIILNHQVALERWRTVVRRLVKDVTMQMNVDGYLNNGKFEDAVRSSLMSYVEHSSNPPLQQLLHILRGLKLNALADAIQQAFSGEHQEMTLA